MTAEDPKTHMWNAHKSSIDYTWCVTAVDCMAKLSRVENYESEQLHRSAAMLIKWHQSTEQRLYRVAKQSVRWPI